jgi:hypothetical protein
MVDGGFMKFTIRIVSWYWTMFRPSQLKVSFSCLLDLKR